MTSLFENDTALGERPSPPRRTTFRHGNLQQALVDAARRRIEQHGATLITLRELARDTGVNHRAIYRHFPDKETLLADVAERSWREFTARLRDAIADQPRGEPSLVKAGTMIFVHGSENPNLYLFATGGEFSRLAELQTVGAAIMESLRIYVDDFIWTGMPPERALTRAALYTTAVQGITTQYIHRRFRVAPQEINGWIRQTCRLLVRGLLGPDDPSSEVAPLNPPAEIVRSDEAAPRSGP